MTLSPSEPQPDADRPEPLVDALGGYAAESRTETAPARDALRSALLAAVVVVIAVSVLVLIL
jgi:hypothetical protein